MLSSNAMLLCIIVEQVLPGSKQLAVAAKFTSPWTCLLVASTVVAARYTMYIYI